MNRLKEPSTWAGFGVLAQMGAGMLPQYAFAFHCITAVAGALAGVIAERGKPKAE